MARSMPRSGCGASTADSAVGPGDDDELGVAEVIGDGAHHPELADHLRRGDEGLPADVATALRQHLVLEMRRRDTRVDVAARSGAGR